MYKIAVVPGDGTGPEVVREGLKVLAAVAQKKSFAYELIHYDIGGERYMKTGDLLPESIISEFRQCSAIYLGAIGHPDVKPGILEKGIQFIQKPFTTETFENSLIRMIQKSKAQSKQIHINAEKLSSREI